MRLIDADALIAEWYRINDIDENDRGARFVGYTEIARLIDNAPTIEKHRAGRWIEHEIPKNVFSIECSECGCWFLREHLVRNSFCPNCGAKMERKEEE